MCVYVCVCMHMYVYVSVDDVRTLKAQVRQICTEVRALLEQDLIPYAQSPESVAFYHNLYVVCCLYSELFLRKFFLCVCICVRVCVL